MVEYGTQSDVDPRWESLETLKGCPPDFGGTLPQLATTIIFASLLERELRENFIKPFWDPYSSLPRCSLHKGACVALSVLTLDFGSGRDHMICEIQPSVWFCT